MGMGSRGEEGPHPRPGAAAFAGTPPAASNCTTRPASSGSPDAGYYDSKTASSGCDEEWSENSLLSPSHKYRATVRIF